VRVSWFQRLTDVSAALGIVFAIAACGVRTIATVQDRSAPVRQPQSAYREVQTGDTLYSIAWESGRDYRDLAQWNDLDPPYVIRRGQKIRLFPPDTVRKARPPRDGFRVVVGGDTLYGIARESGLEVSDLAGWNQLSPPYTISPGQRLRLTPPIGVSVTPSPTPQRTAKRAPQAVDPSESSGSVTWRWPVDGNLIARFAPDDGTKGIDIAGSSGQPIYAAAAGKVVYQGSGLRGYGQLIIVKHNVDFLSAYAHCSTIYVQEGSVIKPGQKIAAMGSSSADRVKLHFEIRRRGEPVDPLDYLPKK
jgi:lipoprotein NlpD